MTPIYSRFCITNCKSADTKTKYHGDMVDEAGCSLDLSYTVMHMHIATSFVCP
jgi:hypothetical protein